MRLSQSQARADPAECSFFPKAVSQHQLLEAKTPGSENAQNVNHNTWLWSRCQAQGDQGGTPKVSHHQDQTYPISS
jgi:hypothetical protein